MGRMVQDRDLASGILRGVTGPLVKVGLGAAVTGTQGTSTINQGTTLTSSADNPDGSGNSLQLVVPGSVPNGATVRTELWGRVIGVRWWRRAATNIVPFDVVVDGIAYPVDNVVTRRDNRTSTAADFEALAIVAADLADTAHTVEVVVTPDPARVTTTSLFLYGFVVERGRGHNDVAPPPRASLVTGSTSLPATATSLNAAANLAYGGLSFHNTDASNPHTVTLIGPGGGTYRALTLAAGASGQVTFPSPKRLTNWQWKADTAAVVTGWMEPA